MQTITGLCIRVDGEGRKGGGEEKGEGRKRGRGGKGGGEERGEGGFITECKPKTCTVLFTLFPEVQLSV